MATSTIKFEHPSSVELGSITATDDKDFLRKVCDKIENLPQNVPGTFHARYSGSYQVYGVYQHSSSVVYIMANRAANRLYSVAKEKATSTYAYYVQEFTAF